MVHDLLGQAYSSIKHNRRRTALTMLGMAWGIATVVILLAYGAGFGRAITAIFSNFGMQMMGVFPGRTSLQAGGQKAGVQVRFTIDDVQHLQEQIPVVRHISPEASFDANVQHENRTQKFNVGGFTPAIVPVRAIKVEEGRFYNDADEMQRSRVAVLGSDAKDKLFSGQPALGESVRIAGISFEVIGVLEPKMQEEGNDNVNAIVYIPFSTMGDIRDTRYLDGIWLDYEGMEYEKVEGNIRSVLGSFHGFNGKDPRAVFVLEHHEEPEQLADHYHGLAGFTDDYRHAHAGNWRRRADEHYAGFRDATHARNWRGKSAGRAAARHTHTVSG